MRARSRSTATTRTRGRGACDSPRPPGSLSVVSDPFVPDVRSSLTIQAFFRALAPGAKVRVWIEGESGGPAVHSTHRAFRVERMAASGGPSLGHTPGGAGHRRGSGSSCRPRGPYGLMI